MARKGELKAKDRVAVVVLAAGGNYKAAAEQSNMAASTLRERCKRSDFLEALLQEHRERREASVETFLEGVRKSVATLVAIMDDETATHAVRERAARSMLHQAHKQDELLFKAETAYLAARLREAEEENEELARENEALRLQLSETEQADGTPIGHPGTHEDEDDVGARGLPPPAPLPERKGGVRSCVCGAGDRGTSHSAGARSRISSASSVRLVSTNASPGPVTVSFFASDGMEKKWTARVAPAESLCR
jgi:hypothetical protein